MDTRILTQGTPNPNALKYVINYDVKTTGKVTFSAVEECKNVPLAQELLSIAHVKQLHFFENVITVTQDGEAEWQMLDNVIREKIIALMPSHDPLFELVAQAPKRQLSADLQKIDDILDRAIRPYLQGDGGDLEVVELDGHVLSIRYEGACGTCPSSIAGTLYAIQNTLQEEFDPNIEVVTV